MDNPQNNTIDCIVDIQGTHIVLIKRGHEPFEDYWALPGGRQAIGEKLEETVDRELFEETGLKVNVQGYNYPTPLNLLGENTFMDQIRTYNSGADPRGGNSTVFAIQLECDPNEVARYLQAGDDAKDIMVCRKDKLPRLAFDHKQFVEDYFLRFKQYKNPTPAVDAIVEYNDTGRYVYIQRGGKPFGPALPGGYAKYGKTFEETVIEEIKEETNLDAVDPVMINVYSDPLRDPRKHISSTLYFAKGHGDLMAGDDACGVGLFDFNSIPDFVIKDHKQMVEDFIRYKNRENEIILGEPLARVEIYGR